MVSQSRKKLVALIALFAVVFAALMPASFARTLSLGDAVALGGICSTGDTTAIDLVGSGNPAMPAGRTATHGHCAFCTLGAPFVAAYRVTAILAIVDAFMPVLPLQRNDALPPDAVAFHPLSPRAPPRAV